MTAKYIFISLIVLAIGHAVMLYQICVLLCGQYTGHVEVIEVVVSVLVLLNVT